MNRIPSSISQKSPRSPSPQRTPSPERSPRSPERAEKNTGSKRRASQSPDNPPSFKKRAVGVLEQPVKIPTEDEEIFNQACQYLKKKGYTTPTFQSWVENPNHPISNCPFLGCALYGIKDVNLLTNIFEIAFKNPKFDVNCAATDGFTLLTGAIGRKCLEVMQLLLQQPGIDVNLAGPSGFTPLNLLLHPFAGVSGYSVEEKIKILNLLLDNNKIDVNKAGKSGNSPLHNAVLMHIPEAIKLLLEKGADPNLKNEFNQTPLDFVLGSGGSDDEKIAAAKAMLLTNLIDDFDRDHPIIQKALEEIQADFKTAE
jgi:ankyrin repeat protein